MQRALNSSNKYFKIIARHENCKYWWWILCSLEGWIYSSARPSPALLGICAAGDPSWPPWLARNAPRCTIRHTLLRKRLVQLLSPIPNGGHSSSVPCVTNELSLPEQYTAAVFQSTEEGLRRLLSGVRMWANLTAYPEEWVQLRGEAIGAPQSS